MADCFDELAEVFKRAEKLAGTVSEELRPAAFEKAVDQLLTDVSPAPRRPSRRNRANAQPTTPTDEIDPVGVILEQLDRTSYPEISRAESVKDRALHVLRIAQNEFEIDGLTAPQIARVLTEKFRLRTTRQAVTQALDRLTDLVDRKAVGRGTLFRLMAPGERYLDGLGDA